MESEVVEVRRRVIPELLTSCCRVNRKAKMLLELLGFHSAAALPAHLHSAILQVLLLGPVSPFSTTPANLPGSAFGRTPGHALPLRSEGFAIQCLFAAWLTKTSKWLKAPRLRYVVLLAVTPDADRVQQPRPSTGSRNGSRPAATASADKPHMEGEISESAASPQQTQQRHVPPPQLLLVAFKVPKQRCLGQVAHAVDCHGLQRAEPSEAFTIDNTHRALCRRVLCETGTHLVLIVEGLGGRLLVLGESRHPASPPPDATSGGTLTTLEELANLINATAPFCAPPKPSRWHGLLQLFAATATPDGLGAPTAIPAFERSETRQGEGKLNKKGGSAPGTLEGTDDAGANSPDSCLAVSAASDAGAQALYGQPHRGSLLALLLRCSLAACHVICRPLTLVTRLPSSLASTPFWSTGAAGATQGLSARDSIKCDWGLIGDGGPSSSRKTCCSYGCARKEPSRRGSGNVCRTTNTARSRQQRTLRQLIDDQQRTMAAFAVRERCRKVALLQQECQMLRQQASRALMDEDGQLFPQARRWVDSTDGQLLMLCLTGHKWRTSASACS